MTSRRFFTALGICLVTAVAGAISYRHQSGLALDHGQPPILAAVWPLCVDGLVMSCGIAIATDRAARMRPRVWALTGFWLGVVVSVTTNWLATDGGLVAHGVSAFPALAFLISVESLSSKPRPAKRTAPQDEPVVVVEPSIPPADAVPVTDVVTRPRAPRAPRARSVSLTAAAKVAAAAQKLPTGTTAQIAARAGVSESTVRRYRPTAPAVSVASPSEHLPARTNGHDVLAGVVA